jgi:hypothetical protein
MPREGEASGTPQLFAFITGACAIITRLRG